METQSSIVDGAQQIVERNERARKRGMRLGVIIGFSGLALMVVRLSLGDLTAAATSGCLGLVGAYLIVENWRR